MSHADETRDLPPEAAALDLPPEAAAVLDALSPQERATLLEQVAHARQASRIELDEAVDGVLGLVPRLVRGKARDILVGHR